MSTSASQKLKTLGSHYKITAWDKLTWSEKLAALKDHTGGESLEEIWSTYEDETKKPATKAVVKRPMEVKKVTPKSVAAGDGVEPPLDGEVLGPVSRDATIYIAPRTIINVPAPAFQRPELGGWRDVVAKAFMWSQGFVIGFLLQAHIVARF